MAYTELFLMLMVGHALADYPLQGEFLSKAKNPNTAIPGIPWLIIMANHAAIHGGMVWFLTGSIWFGLLEFMFHGWIDTAKCRGLLTFSQDQAAHVLCKLLYIAIIWCLT